MSITLSICHQAIALRAMEFLLMPIHQCHAQRPLCGGTCAYACTTTRCALPQRGFTFDSARLASATQPTLGNGCRQGATHNVGCTFFRPHHYPPKRNRRDGACVPARTFAQRRFHNKNTRIVRGELNDGCALVGRHGRAHRHRPYQSPLYIYAQSHTNKITIYT